MPSRSEPGTVGLRHRLRNGHQVEESVDEGIRGDALRLGLEGEQEAMTQDLRGHALRADTGAEIWKSAVLVGAERFQVYWPVVFDEVVFLVGGTYMPSNDNASITNLQRDGMKRS